MGNVNSSKSNEDWEIINSTEIPHQDVDVNINNPIIDADYRIRKYIKEKKMLYYIKGTEPTRNNSELDDLIPTIKNNEKEQN